MLAAEDRDAYLFYAKDELNFYHVVFLFDLIGQGEMDSEVGN